MIDDKKDFEFNESYELSEEKLDLGYSDTSSIGEESNAKVDSALNGGSFAPLTHEDEVEVIEDVAVEVEEVEELEEEVMEDVEVEEAEELVVEEEVAVESEEELEVEKIAVESEEEVETDVEITTPSLVMEEVEEIEEDSEEVDSEIDEYGNVIEVFSAQTRSFNTFTLNDSRLPSGVNKAAGTVSHFGETQGGVSLSVVSGKTTVEGGKYKFQGTARPSLVFTGGILDAKATVSQIKKFENNNIEFDPSSTIENSIRQFLINAANERIDEINGVKYPAASSVNAIDDRAYLTLALSAVLSANESTSNNPELALTFKDLDSLIPKQTTLYFESDTIFSISNLENIKNIVNENSFVGNQPGAGKNSKNVSNLNLNAEGIAVNIDFKVEDPEDGLKTNTRYEFVAPNRDLVFFLKTDSNLNSTQSSIGYVEGLTMTQFKTGKQPPLFETYYVKDKTTIDPISTIATVSTFSTASSDSYLTTNIDFYSIDDTTFIDYDNMVSLAASNVALDTRGTSIKFKTFKIFDKDKTISKIEIEDDRLKRYPVSLAPIDTNNVEKGAYPQVIGLQRATPYTFRKLYITAQPENESITKTFHLTTLSHITGNPVTAIAHNISIRTSTFTEPKLFMEWDTSKAFVSTGNGTFTTTNSQSEVPVFVPKLDVELPNKIKMPAVKNDKTSLRYVIEVENTDVTIKDLLVNGLKGNEQYKVERVDGKDRVYFILTLFNLSENRDYGFLILELTYIDLDGRELITRQVLSGINVITHVNITKAGADFPTTGIVQVPDARLDNSTGPELTGADVFNVTLFQPKTIEARKAEIPVFIDDINGNFLRMEFVKPQGNPDVEVVLEGSTLRFLNLQPKTEVVYKLDFLWRDKTGKEQRLSKYAKISTPSLPAVDVKDATVKPTSTTAEIVFELYSQPKSSIVSVSLSDSSIKFKWNRDKLTLLLEGLKPETNYNDLEVSFKLENGLITKYKVKAFKTTNLVAPPVGPVAEFVSRVYEASLQRKPEVEGWKFWTEKLESKEISVVQFMNDLMTQDEFVNRFLSKDEFIVMMYQIVVGRAPEEEGQRYWGGKYDEYRLQESSLPDLRRRIAVEMMNEQEFKDFVSKLGLKY